MPVSCLAALSCPSAFRFPAPVAPSLRFGEDCQSIQSPRACPHRRLPFWGWSPSLGTSTNGSVALAVSPLILADSSLGNFDCSRVFLEPRPADGVVR